MPELISCQNLSKSYHSKALFENLNFSISDKDRIGLIGPNGAGKSTLLKIIAKLETPDEGEVVSKKFTKIIFVPQNSDIAPAKRELKLFEFCCEYVKNLTESNDNIETKVATALSAGGFENIEVTIGSLSGGWLKKLMICLADTAEPDLILYDEPTNHLDIKSTIWLEKKLRNSTNAWVCVSHDRYFLQKTCNRTLEINKIYKTNFFSLPLAYQEFVQKRFEFFQSEKARADSLRSKLRKENEWLSRQPKARTTKSKSRIDAAYEMQSELSEIKSRLSSKSSKIDFQASGRQTKSLITAKTLGKSFSEKSIIQNLDFEVHKGLRLGLLGDNGSGKSTLLKLFAKKISPDQGGITHADDLQITYFEQTRDTISQDWTLKRALSEEGDYVTFAGNQVHVTSWAAKFQFAPTQLDCLVGDLSGGELARVYIAKLMLQKSDVLILDEPTNDLDIQTLELLEENLESFEGSVIVVSHDRHFLSNVCDKFLALSGDGEAISYASYEQWENSLNKTDNKKKDKPTTSKPKSNNSNKLSYMAQREFDAMEEKILDAESKLESLEAEAAKPENATNSELLAKLGLEINETSVALEKMYERWSELESQKFTD